MSRIARQTYTAEEDSQHIRRKNNPVIISYFSPEVLSVIAGPTLLSVIDDKEVASDTWTSSLFTPHLRANGDGSLPSEILDVIGFHIEIQKQDEVYVALAQYSVCLKK